MTTWHFGIKKIKSFRRSSQMKDNVLPHDAYDIRDALKAHGHPLSDVIWSA